MNGTEAAYARTDHVGAATKDTRGHPGTHKRLCSRRENNTFKLIISRYRLLFSLEPRMFANASSFTPSASSSSSCTRCDTSSPSLCPPDASPASPSPPPSDGSFPPSSRVPPLSPPPLMAPTTPRSGTNPPSRSPWWSSYPPWCHGRISLCFIVSCFSCEWWGRWGGMGRDRLVGTRERVRYPTVDDDGGRRA